MSELNIHPTGDDAVAAKDTPSSTARFRVRGSVPITLIVTARSPEEASHAASGAVTEAFTGIPGVVLSPLRHEIGTPQPAADTADADEPSGYRIDVTAYGHIDVSAEDDIDALTVAEDTLRARLAGRTGVAADLTEAVYDEVTPLVNRDTAGG
jgi:hypothetical protein